MHIEFFYNFCLSLPHTEECFPFGPDNLVFKVGGKIYAITDLNSEVFSVNLKCDPENAIQWREEFPDIQPGYHMNKKHWNTINFHGELTDDFLKQMILHSYELVYNSLSKTKKISLEL